MDPLREKVEEWLRYDPDEATKKEVQELWEGEKQDHGMLGKIMLNRISFGTAGLRGEMRAGYANMNQLTIIQTTQGLITYALENIADLKERGVVIAYDARHHSREFALTTAKIIVSKGVRVRMFGKICPTPLCSFAVKHFKCGLGIMITASHNPSKDNGYKVYWENSAQIIPPVDVNIQNSILKNLKPWAMSESGDEAWMKLVSDPYDEAMNFYLEKIVSYNFHADLNKSAGRFVTFTAMHGVGYEPVQQACKAYGFEPFYPVVEQVQPDPEFPTASFPNPEEPGKLDLAIATAKKNGSTLILANDPDADRLAVAEKQADGSFYVFSGNEIGALLGAWLFQNFKEKYPVKGDQKYLLCASTVSSKFLKKFSEVNGVIFEDTLTGFKWLANKAIDHVGMGNVPLLGFEQAIGYSIGDAVFDKDGVSATVVFAEMANYLRVKEHMTCYEQLQKLYGEYGYFTSRDGYLFIDNPKEKMPAIFDDIRYADGKRSYPEEVGGYKIDSVVDLTIGYDSKAKDGVPRFLVDPKSQMIIFAFQNGTNLVLRGSGTEPKMKYYIEVNGKYEQLEEINKQADDMKMSVIEELIKPAKHGLAL